MVGRREKKTQARNGMLYRYGRIGPKLTYTSRLLSTLARL
jgi:hypothetical protein